MYRKDISLKQLEETLDREMFFKVLKSYIVNLLWVKEIRADELFVGKIKVPLSRRQKSGNFYSNIASKGGKSHTDFAIKTVSDSFDFAIKDIAGVLFSLEIQPFSKIFS